MAGSDRLSTVVRTLVKDDMISGGLTTYQSEKWEISRKQSVNANKQHHLVHNQFYTATGERVYQCLSPQASIYVGWI